MLKFLQMGGYAVYLWPAYALTLVVMGLNIIWARRALRSAQTEARRRLVHAVAGEPRADIESDRATQARTSAGATHQTPAQPPTQIQGRS